MHRHDLSGPESASMIRTQSSTSGNPRAEADVHPGEGWKTAREA